MDQNQRIRCQRCLKLPMNPPAGGIGSRNLRPQQRMKQVLRSLIAMLLPRAKLALKILPKSLFNTLQRPPNSVEIQSRVLFLQMYSKKKPHALGSAYGVMHPHRQKAAHRQPQLAWLLIHKMTPTKQGLKPQRWMMRNLVLFQYPNLLSSPQMVQNHRVAGRFGLEISRRVMTKRHGLEVRLGS